MTFAPAACASEGAGRDGQAAAGDARLGSEWRIERLRVAHYGKAVECAHDLRVRAEWQRRLRAAERRAARLGRRLGIAFAAGLADEEKEDCLIGAMELALQNGDKAAAEAVARECLALAEAHAARALAGSPPRDADA